MCLVNAFLFSRQSTSRDVYNGGSQCESIRTLFRTEKIRPTLTLTTKVGTHVMDHNVEQQASRFHARIFTISRNYIWKNKRKFIEISPPLEFHLFTSRETVALFDQRFPRDLAREKENSGRFVFATQLFEVGTENTDGGMGH